MLKLEGIAQRPHQTPQKRDFLKEKRLKTTRFAKANACWAAAEVGGKTHHAGLGGEETYC